MWQSTYIRKTFENIYLSMQSYILAAIQLASVSAALLQFSPPSSLIIDDYSFDNKFVIKLTSKPASDVLAFYAAPYLSFRDV
jgi:hypothetical protein